MATCTKCRAVLADDTSFCTSCGTSVGASAEASQTGTTDDAPAVGIPANIAALLCYILWPITCALFLVLEPYNKDKFVRFHAFQSLFLGLFSLGVAIGLIILTSLLGLIPVLGWILDFLLWTSYGLGMLGLVIFLIYKTYRGQQYSIPWVGALAAQQAAR